MENTELKLAEPVEKPQEIAQELQDCLGAIQALIQVNDLLIRAPFPIGYGQAIKESCEFIKGLHGQMLTQALAHPDADKVPSLVATRQQQSVGNQE